MAAILADILRPLTLDDFMSMPESGDRVEIISGEMIVSPPPRAEHQDLDLALIRAIDSVILPNRLGKVYTAPIGVVLSQNDVIQPDVLYLTNSRRSLLRGGLIHGAPDLVAEILSPSTRRIDLVRKMVLYRTAGVPEYWIVDPEKRTVSAYSLVEDDYQPIPVADGVVRSRVIPGLEIDVVGLFADIWWSE
jgi:Uma2 family endonuclease